MSEKTNARFKEMINNFAIVHYRKVNKEQIIKAEFALNNAACHYNSVAAVNAGRADKVWLAWVGGKKGVVHIINSKNGKFFDETWHDYTTPYDIRIIREIRESEFDLVCDILVATKDLYFEMFGKKLLRMPYDESVRNEI